MILISNFCRVLNVLCFLLGNSSASEFYMPTFRNTLPSRGSPRHEPYLLHIPACGLHVGCYPPLPVLHPRPTPSLSPSFPLAQAIFKPNLFWYEYPNISPTQSFYTYLSVKMEQTECSETLAYTVQTPGNYPEEGIKH